MKSNTRAMGLGKKLRGFSLTELLVVIAVILILAALIFVGANQVYSMAMQTKCQHHLEQIGHALQMYANKNYGVLPRAKVDATGVLWYETIGSSYVDNLAILGCPSVDALPEIVAREGYVPPNKEEVIDQYRKALYWLKSRQQNGGLNDGMIPSEANLGFYTPSVPLTAMALMGFFGMGYNDRYPEEFADTVRRAVNFLVARAQATNGRFYKKMSGSNNIYGNDVGVQAVSLMGLAAAYLSVEDAELRTQIAGAAQKGLNWLASITGPYGSYGYNTGNSSYGGTNSHGAWVWQAVGDSRRAGFAIPATLDAALNKLLIQNYNSNHSSFGGWGAMTKYYGSSGEYTWTHGIVGGIHYGHRGFPLVLRLSMGDSPSAPIVQSLIGETRTDLQEYKDGLRRYYAFYVTRGLKMAGDNSKWEAWRKAYPEYLDKHFTSEGTDGEGNQKAYWPYTTVGAGSPDGYYTRNHFSTCITLMMLSAAFENNWMDDEYARRGDGECSYGYNDQVGRPGVAVSGDTILVMDYQSWVIFRGLADPSKDDSGDMIALRHGSRANALFGDGAVRPLQFSEIGAGKFTPQSGD